MEKAIRSRPIPLFLALVLASACTGTREDAAIDDGGAWMDGADVKVARDEAAGRETVTLVDPASGHSQLVSDEPLDPGVVEQEVPLAVVAAAGLSS